MLLTLVLTSCGVQHGGSAAPAVGQIGGAAAVDGFDDLEPVPDTARCSPSARHWARSLAASAEVSGCRTHWGPLGPVGFVLASLTDSSCSGSTLTDPQGNVVPETSSRPVPVIADCLWLIAFAGVPQVPFVVAGILLARVHQRAGTARTDPDLPDSRALTAQALTRDPWPAPKPTAGAAEGGIAL